MGIQPRSVETLVLVPDDVVSDFKVSNVTGFGFLEDFVDHRDEKWTYRKESAMVGVSWSFSVVRTLESR